MLQSTQNKRLAEVDLQPSNVKKIWVGPARRYCTTERATWELRAYTGTCKNCEEGLDAHVPITKLVKPPGHYPFFCTYHSCPDLYIRTLYEEYGYYKTVTRMTAAEAVSCLDHLLLQ